VSRVSGHRKLDTVAKGLGPLHSTYKKIRINSYRTFLNQSLWASFASSTSLTSKRELILNARLLQTKSITFVAVD